MSKIKEIYFSYKNAEMGEDVIGWEKEIYEIISKNPNEMNTLIYLFQNEYDVSDKLDLAAILVDLKYDKIIPFLLKTALDKKQEKDNRFDAAMCLVKLQHQQGYESILELAQYKEELPAHWFINELYEINNEMSKKLVKALINKYEHIAELMEPYKDQL